MVPLSVRHPGSGHLGPTTLGHEFIGTVVAAGPAAHDWVGRRVASGAGVSCGHCQPCRRGRTNLCDGYYTLGLSTDGGLAEYVQVPVSTLRPIPEACSDQDAALAQPLAVGLHAVRRAGVQPGDRVAVLGAGAIGSFVLAGLRGHDGPVTALDIDPRRLDLAVALGADDVRRLDPDAPDDQLTGLLDRPADVVLECSGAPGGAARALRLGRRGGTVLLVGLAKGPQALDLTDLVLREVDVRGTVAHVCDVDLPAALDLLTTHPLAELLVDRVVPLERVVPDGLEPLAAGRAGGKILVDPRRG
jgi:(R,R)-butanediol dehydrogenase/meso-butanediol dehydrogenase/diacetyl reductase